MRRFALLLAAITLCSCARGGNPVSVESSAAIFRVTAAETAIDAYGVTGSGSAARACGTIRIRFAIDELAGVGARVIRQETSAVEHDGGAQPGATTVLDVAVPAGGRAFVTTGWTFCGHPIIDFPFQLKSQLTVRDDRGNEQRLPADTSIGFLMP